MAVHKKVRGLPAGSVQSWWSPVCFSSGFATVYFPWADPWADQTLTTPCPSPSIPVQFADEKYGKVAATYEAPAVLLAPVLL